MTRALEKVFEEASRLPDLEQEKIAALVREEMESDEKWAASFEKSQGLLSKMAAEAMAEDDRGETKPMGDQGEIADD